MTGKPITALLILSSFPLMMIRIKKIQVKEIILHLQFYYNLFYISQYNYVTLLTKLT